jgi:branched-chain amino acid transport system ATP-binding protein
MPTLDRQKRNMAVLILENISVSYGAIRAIQNVSLRVERGELVGVIGANGAGKSTTLMTIVGVLQPTQGTILFNGESIVNLPPEDIVRKGISIVPEGRRIISRLTVAENLRLGAAIYYSNRVKVQSELEKMCALFPILGDRLDQVAGTLSGGEQQQLAIARGMMSRPDLLLLDEPSLGLAPLLVDEIFELINRLRESGVTILLVEQNVHRTLDMADRVYLLDTGSVKFGGTPTDLRKRVDIASQYLGLSSDQQGEE